MKLITKDGNERQIKEETINELPFLITDIKKVYIGKQGCACGCGGNYYEQNNLRMLKLLMTKFKRLAETNPIETYDENWEDEKMYAIELENRAIRFYIKVKQ